MINSLAQQLSPFVYPGTEFLCAQWLIEGKIQLRIAAPRKTKLGDFRPAHLNLSHRISVNRNLDPLRFLITLTHEVAHAFNWDKHGRKVQPHGREWKHIYSLLLTKIIDLNVLDRDTALALRNHSINPGASSTTDIHLQNLLSSEHSQVVNDLPPGSSFTLDGRFFKTIRKLRKYWLCEEFPTRKHFRVLGTARVDQVELSEHI